MTGWREGETAPAPLVFSVPEFFVVALCSMASGCGGGLPLLHPARTLQPGDVRAFAGFSSNLAVGGLSAAIRRAANQSAANQGPSSPGNETYADGAIAAASIGPGVAPVAGARLGVGAQTEGGLAYTGRAIRADFRRSFNLSAVWAFSAGAAGSAALYGAGQTDALPGVDLGHLHGWGADVPMLIGYQSPGDLYMLWTGVRVGWEHVNVDALTSMAGSGVSPAPISLSATRVWGGGLVGLAVGFRHVHVAMELDVSYATITGDFNAAHVTIAGATVAPASALWWQF